MKLYSLFKTGINRIMGKKVFYGVAYDEIDPRLDQCNKLLFETYETAANLLYDAIEDFLFQDVYSEATSIAVEQSQWIMKLGRSSESPLSKTDFEKIKNTVTNPNIKKYVYFYDLCSIISAIQDRLQSIEFLMKELYNQVPSTEHYSNPSYDGAKLFCGYKETIIHETLNIIFVSMASVLDLMAKIANEQFSYGDYDFNKYSKLHSTKTSYNSENPAHGVDPSLENDDTIFKKKIELVTVEEIRNEYVHNGSWDLRTGIYVTRVKGQPADVCMFFPDMGADGRFEKSGSRNKFYSQGTKINVILPDMVINVITKVKNSIEQIVELYKKSTHLNPDTKLTAEFIKDVEASWNVFTSCYAPKTK